MAIGAIPQNQLDALPLLTAAQAVQASTILRSGAGLLRSFSPDDLAINGIAPATVNTRVCLVTPYLDLSFCNRFKFTLRRVSSAGALGALNNCSLNIQCRMGSADAPAVTYVTGASIHDELNAVVNISSSSVAFIGIGAPPETQTACWGWGDSMGTGLGYNQAIALGGNCRFIVSWSTNPVAATNLFTAYLDAQT